MDMIKEARGFIKLMCNIVASLLLTYLIYTDVAPKSIDFIDVALLLALFLSILSFISIFTLDHD